MAADGRAPTDLPLSTAGARAVRTGRAVLVPAWCALLTFIVMRPLADRGWVVLLDWVVGPETRFASRILSGASLPAGPVFFSSAAALHALTGPAVGWLLPALCLLGGGYGASRLGPPSYRARLVAATAFIWNPFVHERLCAGHVAVLFGYALLPYVALAAMRAVEDRRPRRVAALVAWWSLSSAVSIHFLVLGFVVLAAVVAGSVVSRSMVSGQGVGGVRRMPWRLLVAGTVGTLTVTACWLVPTASDAPDPGDMRTVAAFATRGADRLALVVGAAGQSGFWRPSVHAPGLASGWWWSWIVIATWALIAGVAWAHRRSVHGPWVAAAMFCATVGWLLGQGTDGLVGPLVRVLIELPGMGIMREPGKFLALVSLGWSAGLAVCAHTFGSVLPAVGSRGGRRVAALLTSAATCAGFLALPVSLTPQLAWGVRGQLAAVSFPPGWWAMRDELARRPAGRVLVLPWIGYGDLGFTNGRVVRHPARAFFGDRAMISEDMGVEGLVVPASTQAVRRALEGSDPVADLRAIGVAWVVAPETMGLQNRWTGVQVEASEAGIALYAVGPRRTVPGQ